jgi:gliding motility-associated-like protein
MIHSKNQKQPEKKPKNRGCFSILFFCNGLDGLNDTLIPKIKAVSSFTMDVFNTWGERIYSTNGLESKGWDGTSNGQILPASNYLYRITYVSSDGRQFEKTGVITLIR